MIAVLQRILILHYTYPIQRGGKQNTLPSFRPTSCYGVNPPHNNIHVLAQNQLNDACIRKLEILNVLSIFMLQCDTPIAALKGDHSIKL